MITCSNIRRLRLSNRTFCSIITSRRSYRFGIVILVLFIISSYFTPAGATTYQYDSPNRLALVKYDDSTMIHYTYDEADNRTKMF